MMIVVGAMLLFVIVFAWRTNADCNFGEVELCTNNPGGQCPMVQGGQSVCAQPCQMGQAGCMGTYSDVNLLRIYGNTVYTGSCRLRKMSNQKNWIKETDWLCCVSSPQGNLQQPYAPPNQQSGYLPPNQQSGFSPPNQQLSYSPTQQTGFPPNQQNGFPPNQQNGFPQNQQQSGFPQTQQPGFPTAQQPGFTGPSNYLASPTQTDPTMYNQNQPNTQQGTNTQSNNVPYQPPTNNNQMQQPFNNPNNSPTY